MKVAILSLVLAMSSNFAFSELTVEDLEAIRSIVKNEIAESEERINLKIEKVEVWFKAIDNRFERLEKQYDHLINSLIALVSCFVIIILAVFGLLWKVNSNLMEHLGKIKIFEDLAEKSLNNAMEINQKIREYMGQVADTVEASRD